jgi:chloride channel 7
LIIFVIFYQGKSSTFGVDTTFSKYQDFRNDREKRDFVSCGAAAGVAAAFGAPIGGVLFSLEEGASFWSTKLTWRCFFCAMTTVFTLYAINTANSLFGHSDSTAMFSFGEFFSLQGEQSNYSVWELSLFMLVGCMGGLIGACFNTLVHQVFVWRSENVISRTRRLVEVLLVVGAMSLLALLLPLAWQKCTPLPTNMEGWSDQEKGLVEELVPLYCNKETHYNELASLFLTDSDTSIRQLFHFREIGDVDNSTFSSSALFLFFVPYLTMACITYGTAVPAGMFVPSLMSGAAFGRLIGHLLHKLDNTSGTFADSGTYALMGAAAITSGIARMTISLTVMVLEATGDMQYVLPLMLTVMTARLVGNIFTEGLYDMHIHSRRLNFLDEDEGVSKLVELHDLSVCEIMTRAPRHMAPVMRVGDLYDLLKLNKHHCYPVGKFFVECLLVSSSDPVVSQSNRTRIVFWSAPSCARSFARSCSTRRLA